MTTSILETPSAVSSVPFEPYREMADAELEERIQFVKSAWANNF